MTIEQLGSAGERIAAIAAVVTLGTRGYVTRVAARDAHADAG